MQAKIHNAKKTYEQYLNDLKAGKAVKATDLCASMGIKTIVFE